MNKRCKRCAGSGEEICHQCEGRGYTFKMSEKVKDCDACQGLGVIDCPACIGIGEEPVPFYSVGG